MMMSNKSQPINKWPVDSIAATWHVSDTLSTLSTAFLLTLICQDSVTSCYSFYDQYETVHNK